MKAIILAAGMGTRLHNHIPNLPKSLININGIAILQNQVESLLKNGIDEIYIVVGYLKEKIINFLNDKMYKNVFVVENNNFKNTNNMFSLFLTKDKINDDVIIMNGDVFFDQTIIGEICNNNVNNLIVCQKDAYNDESMKISTTNFEGGLKINSISKTLQKNHSSGISLDIYKFSKKTINNLFSIIEKKYIKNGILNKWTEEAFDDLFYIEIIKPHYTSKKWVEIDNDYDLSLALKLFRMNSD